MPESHGDFDPYLKWLGIRDPERPPNHYRLLGVELFESDLDVIATAADRQMAHVRRFHHGQRVELTQKLLNELAAAKVCLLRPADKVGYDEQLRLRQLAAHREYPVAAAPRRSTASPRIRVALTLLGIVGLLSLGSWVILSRGSRELPARLADRDSQDRTVASLPPAPVSTPQSDNNMSLPDTGNRAPHGPEEVDAHDETLSDPASDDPSVPRESAGVPDVEEAVALEETSPDDLGGEETELLDSEATPPGEFSGLSPQAKRVGMEAYRQTGIRRARAPDAGYSRTIESTDQPPSNDAPTAADAMNVPEQTPGPTDDTKAPSVQLAMLDGGPASTSATFARLREALREREIDTAWSCLGDLANEATTYEQRDAVDRLRILYFQWERFWQAFDAGVAALDVGATLELNGNQLKVKELSPGRIVWETASGPKEVNVDRTKVDARLAIILSSFELSRRGALVDPPVAAFLAVDRSGDPQEAAKLWRRMQQAGQMTPFPVPMTPPETPE